MLPTDRCRQGAGGKPPQFCNRELYKRPDGVADNYCLFHSRYELKDKDEVLAALKREIWNDGDRDMDNFSRSVFPDGMTFERLKFPRPVHFGGSRFVGYSSFLYTEFASEAYFDRAIFDHGLLFTRARFRGEVTFEEATFNSIAIFGEAKFTGPAYFIRTKFATIASFPSTVVENVILIQDSNCGPIPDNVSELPTLDISSARTRGSGAFHVIHVNHDSTPLHLRALNAVLDRCRFEDVNWHRKDGRLVLRDEADMAYLRVSNPELVKIAYDRLTAVFDSTRSYDLAEECFVGAMEMTRRSPNTSRWHRSWLSAYRRVSNYGTSYLRPLLFLVGTFVLFSLLYAMPLSGLTITNPVAGPIESGLAIQSSLDRGLAAIVHSAQVSLFARQRDYQPGLPIGVILTTVQPLLVAVHTAIFLLALRRRFHRGH